MEGPLTTPLCFAAAPGGVPKLGGSWADCTGQERVTRTPHRHAAATPGPAGVTARSINPR
jgi:hypothetical protein